MDPPVSSEVRRSRMSSMKASLLEEGYTEYTYRYVILALFFGVSITNQLTWVTCSPIAEDIQRIYGVSDLTVYLSTMTAMIVFIPAMVPGNYILDEYGTKIGLMVGAALTVGGAWIRILLNHSFYFVLLGQLLAALGQPMILNCPQKISAFWIFPRNRTIFTTVLTLAAPLGVAVGFVLPGVFVGDTSGPDDVFKLMWIEAIVSSVLCAPLFIFYRERPPTYPSASAELERDDFKLGLKKILRDGNFLLLMLVVGFGLGVYNCLATVVQTLITPFGFKSLDASILGAMIIIFGIIGSVVFGLYVEKTRKYKNALSICALLSLVGMVAFSMVLFTENIVAVAAVTSFLGFCLTPILPLGLELACEITFPVGEAVSGGAMIGMSQIIGVIQILGVTLLMKQDNGPRGVVLSAVIFIIFISAVFVCSSYIHEDLRRIKHDRRGSRANSLKNSFASSKHELVTTPEQKEV